MHILQRQPKRYETRKVGRFFTNSCRALLPLFPLMKSQIWVNSLWPDRQDYLKEAIKLEHTWNRNVGHGRQRRAGGGGGKSSSLLLQLSRHVSQQPAKQVTIPSADGKRDDNSNTAPWTACNSGSGKHTPRSRADPSSSPQGTTSLSSHRRILYSLATVSNPTCKGKENPTARARSGLQPSPPSPGFAAPSYPE